MKILNLFNIVRVIIGTFIIGWWLVIARNFSDSSDMKVHTAHIWIENMAIAVLISIVTIVILKIKKIKVF